MILYPSAVPETSNLAMILANRAVILFKIREFRLSIEDINLSIETKRYPLVSLHKLYHRLAKTYEHLQEYTLAINCYKKAYDSLKVSNLSKSQKLQIKSETENAINFCKKGVVGLNLTSYKCDGIQDTTTNFPVYKATHSDIQNASGVFVFCNVVVMFHLLDILKYNFIPIVIKLFMILTHFTTSRWPGSHVYPRERSFCCCLKRH